MAALQRVEMRTALLTHGVLLRLGCASSLKQLELELSDALCARGKVTLCELAPLAALERLTVTTKCGWLDVASCV